MAAPRTLTSVSTADFSGASDVSGKRRAASPAGTKGAKRPRTRKQKVWRVAKWFLIVGLVGLLV